MQELILHLRIVEASDIPVMDADSTDAYCVIQLIPQSTYKEKTSVIEKTRSPRWNQEFHIPINDIQSTSLYITLYDKDNYKDDIISTLILQLASVPVGTVVDQWYTMIPAEQVQEGGILHIVTHVATKDAQPFLQIPQENEDHSIKGCSMPGMYSPGQIPQQYPPQMQYCQQPASPQQQMSYPQPQASYPQQTYPQPQAYQQSPYPQPPQQVPYTQQPIYTQQPVYPQQPVMMPPQQPYDPQQAQYYPQTYNQPGVPPQPNQGYPYGYPCDTPPPPRPPGMNDDQYKKLKKAQKKILKKIMKGDIQGGLKKGMKYLLKV